MMDPLPCFTTAGLAPLPFFCPNPSPSLAEESSEAAAVCFALRALRSASASLATALSLLMCVVFGTAVRSLLVVVCSIDAGTDTTRHNHGSLGPLRLLLGARGPAAQGRNVVEGEVGPQERQGLLPAHARRDVDGLVGCLVMLVWLVWFVLESGGVGWVVWTVEKGGLCECGAKQSKQRRERKSKQGQTLSVLRLPLALAASSPNKSRKSSCLCPREEEVGFVS